MTDDNGSAKEELRKLSESEDSAKETSKLSGDTLSSPENEAYIEDNTMTIKLYLWGEAAYAKSMGSLILAQDIVRNHFAILASRNAMARPKIIKPNGLVH